MSEMRDHHQDCTCDDASSSSSRSLSRRGLLAGLGAVGAAGLLDVAGPRYAFAAGAPKGDTLVYLFLRGAMDGLNAVVPVAEPDYYRVRPTINVPKSVALPLDRTFALHPKLAPLKAAWANGDLAIVHAAGDADGTRSHFDAQDAMERGVGQNDNAVSGWIDRAFMTRPVGLANFPGVALGYAVPVSQRGPAPDIAMLSAGDFRVRCPDNIEKPLYAALSALFNGLTDSAAVQARLTLEAIGLLSARRGKTYTPANGAVYPATEYGRQLKEIAQLIKSGVGMEAATLSLDGWDLHTAAGTPSTGPMADLLTNLGSGLAAFYADLGSHMKSVTVVVMSEFGRTFAENGSAGTDHGWGNCMFVMGGGIRGGKVYARWPGLGKTQLDKQGDLRVTTDYRDVLGEIVQKRLGNPKLTEVFPHFKPTFVGLAEQR